MKNATDITILLDRSGSMYSCAETTKEAINGFIKEQKNVKGEARITLIQFDSEDPQEVVLDNIDLQTSPVLDNYEPRGGTPLFDAMGRAINNLGQRLKNLPESERPDKVIFVLMTDGFENQSREFNLTKIREMVTTQQNVFNWQFVFLGADLDQKQLEQFTTSIGVSALNSVGFSKEDTHFHGNMKMFSAKTAKYRGSNDATQLNYTEEEKAQHKGD